MELDVLRRGEFFEIRLRKRIRVAEDGELAPIVRTEAARNAGLDCARIPVRNADQVRADEVGGVGRARGEQRAHVPGRALRWAVALHAQHRVHQRQPRADVFVQIDEHAAKIVRARVQIVEFRLARAGDAAEEVLHRAAHARHRVRFQLAEVDHAVGLVEPRRERERLHRLAFRKAHFFLRKIVIQLRAHGLDGAHTGAAVNGVHPRGVPRAAGAVAHRDLRAALDQEPAQLCHQHRVRHRAGPGLHFCDQIRLDRDFHARRDPVQPADRLDRRQDCAARRGRFVVRTGDDGNVVRHWPYLLRKFQSQLMFFLIVSGFFPQINCVLKMTYVKNYCPIPAAVC